MRKATQVRAKQSSIEIPLHKWKAYTRTKSEALIIINGASGRNISSKVAPLKLAADKDQRQALCDLAHQANYVDWNFLAETLKR